LKFVIKLRFIRFNSDNYFQGHFNAVFIQFFKLISPSFTFYHNKSSALHPALVLHFLCFICYSNRSTCSILDVPLGSLRSMSSTQQMNNKTIASFSLHVKTDGREKKLINFKQEVKESFWIIFNIVIKNMNLFNL